MGRAQVIRAVLLDRDGVLNIDHVYVATEDRFDWVEGAREAVKMLNDRGILAIVITNQSGIARGIFSMADFDTFMALMQEQLREIGAHLDDVYVCPHHPTEGRGEYLLDCDCRKPKPGLIVKALAAHGLLPGEAIMIGDKPRDAMAAEGAGVKGLTFTSGNLLEFIQQALAATEAPALGVE